MKKGILLVVLSFILVFAFTACGPSVVNLDGTWVLTTIDDMSLEDAAAYYSEQFGTEVTAETLSSEWEISGTNATTTGVTGSAELTLELKSDGAEATAVIDSSFTFSLKYDEEAQTLTYQADSGLGEINTYVLEKQ